MRGSQGSDQSEVEKLASSSGCGHRPHGDLLFADPWQLSEDKQTMRKLVNTGGNLTQGIGRGSLKRMTSRLSRRVQQNSLHEWRPQDIQDIL